MRHDETIEGTRRTASKLKAEGYEIINWISIHCSAWCSWQGVNLNTVEGYEKTFEEKKHESLILVKGVKTIVKFTEAES